jgi:YVTN family beta-propeller protein
MTSVTELQVIRTDVSDLAAEPLDKGLPRPIIKHSGGAMKYAFVLLTVCCSLSAVYGQWLETTIPLDSGANPWALCYNWVNDKVYVANADARTVSIIDAATNEIIATVPAGVFPCSICYNDQLNKVYCSGSTGSFITVIDGSTDSVVARIDVPEGIYTIYYNPQSNKVYGGRAGPNVVVADCWGDSLVTTVTAQGSALDFCYNSRNNKVYFASEGYVGVIDGATDSLSAEVSLGVNRMPYALCYDPTDNKVYCTEFEGRGVFVIDGASDTIVAKVSVSAGNALCYCQRWNKVYVTQRGSGVSVIDCATDSVVAMIPSAGGSEAILFDAKSDKVFCAEAAVVVIDAAADTVLRTIEAGYALTDLCSSPAHNRVYVASAQNSTIAVLADSTSGIEEGPKSQPTSRKLAATVMRSLPQGAVAFDAMGRRVANPRPGIYFVRDEGQRTKDETTGRMRKVVITR